MHEMHVRIFSLDLSKAFDQVIWAQLWGAFVGYGIYKHLIWIMQLRYADQVGEVMGN